MSESEHREEPVEEPPSEDADAVDAEPAGTDVPSTEDEEADSATTLVPPSEAEGGRIDERWADEAQLPVLKRALESLIFVSDRIITHVQLARLVRARPAQVRQLLGELVEESESRGVQLVEVSGGYQYRTAPACAPFVREVVAQKPVRLTRAQLETLALIAYRQPMTRPEVDDVRGVDTGSAIKVLLDRALIKMLGRKDEAGRPMLYGTTPYFLEFFGLKSLRDLPTLKEFTDLSEDSRALFKRKTGESVDQSTPPAGDEVAPTEFVESDWDVEEENEEFAGETAPKESDEETSTASSPNDGDTEQAVEGAEEADDVVEENTRTHTAD